MEAVDRKAGAVISCPKCQMPLRVPSLRGERDKAAPKQDAGSQPAGPKIRFSCPTCRRSFEYPHSSAGQKIFCQCGAKVEIPTPPPPKTVMGVLEEAAPHAIPLGQPPSQISVPPPLPPPVAPVATLTPQPGYTPGTAPGPVPAAVEPQFRCPYCKCDMIPKRKTRVSQAGWGLFIIMLCIVGCGWLFIWIPLVLMRESYRLCSYCGMEIG